MDFCNQVRQETDFYWEASFRHLFVRGIADGSLLLEKFKMYMLQNAYYLKYYTKVLALAAAKAERDDEIIYFLSMAQFIHGAELEIHRTTFRELGVTEEEITMFEPASAAYNQEDVHIHQFRERMIGKIIGVSVHNEQQLHDAVDSGADYVGIGAIFTTQSKEDHTRTNIAFLQRAKQLYPCLPIVAIGGITCQTSDYVRKHGADGVAVISAISLSDNIEKTVKSL